ncbi:hypothetical protein IP86_03060 [Rhodopseudomonas sp. AAP120]|uniref:hypothetical protein n=1 Tax=Rhodopseudomonas sp. AAP120 TaxID=1523430 RepID=UPI0006B8A315|nr:hypothetical protein [Rhodopseudomonas sp. AAP120]KPG01802.1 hypothetical protein IP86_03060 [Rhodopseudomonas sp. AAP120]
MMEDETTLVELHAHGAPGSGKSTLLNYIRDLLGNDGFVVAKSLPNERLSCHMPANFATERAFRDKHCLKPQDIRDMAAKVAELQTLLAHSGRALWMAHEIFARENQDGELASFFYARGKKAIEAAGCAHQSDDDIPW